MKEITIKIKNTWEFAVLLDRYRDKVKPDATESDVIDSLLEWAYGEAWL